MRAEHHPRPHRAAVSRSSPDEEFELYNLDDDPTETENLAHRSNRDRGTRKIQDQLVALLGELRSQKAARPRNRETP